MVYGLQSICPWTPLSVSKRMIGAHGGSLLDCLLFTAACLLITACRPRTSCWPRYSLKSGMITPGISAHLHYPLLSLGRTFIIQQLAKALVLLRFPSERMTVIGYFRQNRCPICKSPISKSNRIHRSFWMRLIPRTCYYRCAECYCKFVTVFGCIVMVLFKEP
jgi:hypothetical protein